MSESASGETEGWHPINSPASAKAYWMAALAGLALRGGLCSGLIVWSWLVQDRAGMATAGDVMSPWVAASVAIILFVPLHEFIHLLGQPDMGRTNQSVLAIWPSRLRFGVYYEGCMSRGRWLGMRLAPLIVLSVLPACLVGLLQVLPWTADLEVGLQVMMVMNALGSGGDLVAAILVLLQVPAKGQLCFRAGRSYWRPA